MLAVILILSQLPSQQREVTIAHGDEAILHRMKEEEEEEGTGKRLIGELLPQKAARERMIRLRVTVCRISYSIILARTFDVFSLVDR